MTFCWDNDKEASAGLRVLQRYKVKQKLLDVVTGQGKRLEDANVRQSGRLQFANGVNMP